MILNPQKMLDVGVVTPGPTTRCAQNGIDLTLKESIELQPHSFQLVELNEKISLPQDVCATLHIRSTYSRQGITLSSGLWDSGFVGNLGCSLQNHSDKSIVIAKGERVCQVVCYEAEAASLYNGQYQGK